VLAILSVLNSAVGAYYYLRIVVLMYLGETPEQQEEVRVRGGWPVAASVGAYAGLTVLLGLFWAPLAETAREAARAAAAHPEPARPGVTTIADSTPTRP
jgi:NADH-quinone oxidoreductase subunit N